MSELVESITVDSSNETDDLEDNILSQALPVANLGKDIDLNVPPATGEEYLYRVRYKLAL